MKRVFLLIAIFAVILLCNQSVTGGEPADKEPVEKERQKEQRRAILLVAFGTSVPEANVAYSNIDEEFKRTFPNMEIRWAYTAKFIRNKLKKRGEIFLSPAEALAKLGEDGYTDVAVQSLHVIPGSEYEDLVRVVDAFQNMPKGTQRVTLGAPLAFYHSNMVALSSAMIANIPEERSKSDAVVFMGHGSHHQGNIYYPGANYYLSQQDENIFVGTVEGTPTLTDIIVKLKRDKIRKVWLIPFMAVAGDHARNDMAGDEDDSWKSILEREGFQVAVDLHGMAEFDNIVSLWIDNLKASIEDE